MARFWLLSGVAQGFSAKVLENLRLRDTRIKHERDVDSTLINSMRQHLQYIVLISLGPAFRNIEASFG